MCVCVCVCVHVCVRVRVRVCVCVCVCVRVYLYVVVVSAPATCPGFQCSNGKCLDPRQVCDFIKDCSDGGDEVTCRKCWQCY